MPNVFDVDAATKCVVEVGRLTAELAGLDEMRKGLKAQLKSKKAEMKQIVAGPRKAKKA
jgi:hypothetical protein